MILISAINKAVNTITNKKKVIITLTELFLDTAMK